MARAQCFGPNSPTHRRELKDRSAASQHRLSATVNSPLGAGRGPVSPLPFGFRPSEASNAVALAEKSAGGRCYALVVWRCARRPPPPPG